MLASCLLAAAQAGADSVPVRHDTPLAESVTLTISTDRQSYFLNEPVQITMTLENVTDEPIRGYFVLIAGSSHTELWYRHGTTAFSALSCRPWNRRDGPGRLVGWLNVAVRPRVLATHSQVTATTLLSLDETSGKTVLAEPGPYEFKVVYRDLFNDPKAVVSSNVVRVVVKEPGPLEAEAAREYADARIASLVQDEPDSDLVAPDSIDVAARFLRDHPESLYAKHVSQALLRHLGESVRGNQATPAHLELYKELAAQHRKELEEK